MPYVETASRLLLQKNIVQERKRRKRVPVGVFRRGQADRPRNLKVT